MPRGRTPLEDSAKRRRARKNRTIVGDEADVEQKLGAAPSCLDREARAEWRRLVRALAPTGMLSAADRGNLAILCQAWSAFVAATKADDAGLVDTTAKRYATLSKDFGLTPKARQAIRVVKPDEKAKREPGAKDPARFFAPRIAS